MDPVQSQLISPLTINHHGAPSHRRRSPGRNKKYHYYKSAKKPSVEYSYKPGTYLPHEKRP